MFANWETSEPTSFVFFFYFNKGQRHQTPRQIVGRSSIFQERDLRREGQASKPCCSFCGEVQSLQKWMPSSSTQQIYTRISETESQTKKKLRWRKQEQAITAKAELSPGL